MRRREFITLTATIVFAIGLSGITAIAEPKVLNERLVGTWHLYGLETSGDVGTQAN